MFEEGSKFDIKVVFRQGAREVKEWYCGKRRRKEKKRIVMNGIVGLQDAN